MRRVPMLDLKAEWAIYGADVRAAIECVLDHQQFVGGPEVKQFEAAMAARLGVKHAIAVSNGTEALVLALMALRIGPGDEVITTAFTFFATAASIVRVGAKPVFVDIDARTFNIDPARIESAITPRTKAIMPVHLYGQCADMDPILKVAAARKLAVVEDAAQAFGATYHGRPACSIGACATLSFYPTKNLAAPGEGGMITTNDDALANTLAKMRNQGERQRYHHQYVAGNFRLDTLKAAALLTKLPHVDGLTRKRQANAARYSKALLGTPITPPAVGEGNTHVYHQYSVLCEQRDALVHHLTECGVGSTVYYPIPVHLQECLSSLGHKAGDFPVAESVAARVVSLPVHPLLADADVDYVIDVLKRFAA